MIQDSEEDANRAVKKKRTRLSGQSSNFTAALAGRAKSLQDGALLPDYITSIACFKAMDSVLWINLSGAAADKRQGALALAEIDAGR